MPTYEYVCQACDHHFEEFQSIMADPLKKCPKCKKNKLERQLGTGAAVVFKGSGFYQTDYRSDSYKKSADADKKSTETASESKSEKKGAKKEKASSKESKPAKSSSKDD